MLAAKTYSLGALREQLLARDHTEVSSVTVTMADQRIAVECDDRPFFAEFFKMFGGPKPSTGRSGIPSDVHADIRAHIHPEFGLFRMSGSNDLPVDAREFSFAVQEEKGPFERLPTQEPGWTCIAFRGTRIPAFAFYGRDCLFALGDQWRPSITWYLFWRLLRIRSDVIFFHASAVDMFGEGTIFVGGKGAGKSTTSLALAARGHNFLSDEIAGYLPQSGALIPFRRPVGLKPGPRSSAVAAGLTPCLSSLIERDGFARVDINSLFAVEPARQSMLRRIVFLRGFAERSLIKRIEPGRAEIAELQPLLSSFLNAPHSQRIFELARLLSGAKVYEFHPGEPDASAAYLEEAFARECQSA